MTSPGFYGWKLLAAFWVVMFINLAFPAYGSSVINAAMLIDLRLDRQTLGWVFSTYMIMSGLPGPLVALSINRYGSRTTLLVFANDNGIDCFSLNSPARSKCGDSRRSIARARSTKKPCSG
jgi:MFS family permease